LYVMHHAGVDAFILITYKITLETL
jgi:hypothetical protein